MVSRFVMCNYLFFLIYERLEDFLEDRSAGTYA